MKKDLQSYRKHDLGYESEPEYYTKEAILERTENGNYFQNLGFKLAISITKNLPRNHIDIGSGVGWLVAKMSPYFTKSIGIEPSKKAVEAAMVLTENMDNVSFLEMDMVDAYKKLDIKEATFFTTSTVLSHIEDFYVAELLKLINNAPNGSVLFFNENYDKNINWRMWHIRNKEWWRNNLPGWQLIFLDIDNNSYSAGIYGIKISEKEILNTQKRSMLWDIFWKIDYILNISNRIVNKIKSYFIKNLSFK